MSRITIGDDWAIDSDRYCWNLRRRSVVQSGKNKGLVEWDIVGHYPSLQMALKQLPEHAMREWDCEGFDALRTRMNELAEHIEDALSWETLG